MTATTHQLMLFTRLKPRTKWAGGRITDTDAVTLEDASRLASEHAGVEITTADFLRAAARGEILLRALAPRTVTFQPSRESDKPLLMPQNSIPTLPLNACKGLANVGQAMWRNCEDFEKLDTVLGEEFSRFTRWELDENESDLLTTLDDCRVTGLDVHALADAYIEASTQRNKESAWANGESTFVHSTKTRRDILTPVIEFAQAKCRDPNDAAEVWGVLQRLGEQKIPPLFGGSDDGVQYLSGGQAMYFKRKSLGQSLTRLGSLRRAKAR